MLASLQRVITLTLLATVLWPLSSFICRYSNGNNVALAFAPPVMTATPALLDEDASGLYL